MKKRFLKLALCLLLALSANPVFAQVGLGVKPGQLILTQNVIYGVDPNNNSAETGTSLLLLQKGSSNPVTKFRVDGDGVLLNGTIPWARVSGGPAGGYDSTPDTIADDGVISSGEVNFNYAGSNSKGGDAYNSDTVDSLHVNAGRNTTPNQIVRTDANGYIQAGWINTDSGDSGIGNDISRIYTSYDNYLRYLSKSDFKVLLGLSGKSTWDRRDYTTNSDYWVGSVGQNGWDMNTTLFDQGSNFFDVWDGSNFPPGTSHVHGIQAEHYTNGSTRYGWQLAGQYNQNGRLFVRTFNGGTINSWQGIYSDTYRPYADTAGNATNATNATNAGNADTVDSLHASNFLRADNDSPAGNASLAASNNGNTSYSVAALELRESNYGGAGYLPPRLSFHWGGVVASQLTIESDGKIAVRNNPGTNYENFRANNFYSDALGDWLTNRLGQDVRSSASPTFNSVTGAEMYTSGWFRNNESGEGLYNGANGNHFYSSSGNYWNITAADPVNGYPALLFRSTHNSTIRGYVYSDSNGFGLLSGDGSWRVRTYSGGQMLYGNTTVTGNLTTNGDVYSDTAGKWLSNTITKSGDTVNAAIYFRSNKGSNSYVGNNSTYGLEVYSDDGGAAGMSFHRSGAYAVNMGLDPDNVLRIGGWSAGVNRWQLDMSGNQTLAGGQNLAGNLNINNASPTIYFQDTDHRSSMIHVNSNIFYVLRGCGTNDGSWCTSGGYWPLEINLENNNATFGGVVSAVGGVKMGTSGPTVKQIHYTGYTSGSNNGRTCIAVSRPFDLNKVLNISGTIRASGNSIIPVHSFDNGWGWALWYENGTGPTCGAGGPWLSIYPTSWTYTVLANGYYNLVISYYD